MSVPEVFRKRRSDGDVLVVDLAFLAREPAEVYHAQSNRYLTSHRLADFRRAPALFRKKELGLVREEDRPAYIIGRAAHALILEGRESYERAFAFRGPINPRTGEPFGIGTKAFQRWAYAHGKSVLNNDQAALVENLSTAVSAQQHAADLLSDGVAEGVVRGEYCGIPCQARLDWFNSHRGIVDLKTCDSLDWFEADARRYGYAHQVVFYRALVTAVTGRAVPVYIIAVEKREPYRSGVWRMGEDVLGFAQQENEKAIERLKTCREKDSWPTGYEEIRIFDWI